jgi:hypothetical protein
MSDELYRRIYERDSKLHETLVDMYNSGASSTDIFNAVGMQSPLLAQYMKWGLFSSGDLRKEPGWVTLSTSEEDSMVIMELVKDIYRLFVKDDGTLDDEAYPDINEGLR